MRKTGIAAVLALSGMLLFGCAGGGSTSTFSPRQNSIFVTRDGQISSALVETYDKDYYDEAELKASIEEAVAAYNTEAGKTGVTLTSCIMKEGKAIAVFGYDSGATLYDFTTMMEDEANQARNLELSTVSEGLVAGKVSDGSWIKAKDGSSVSLDTITKQGDMKLLSLEGTVTLQTESEIQYYSGNITLIDKFTASVSGGKAYIAFK